ncbi:hypothetical protein C4K40_0729 [Pseudomonas sp. CMR5c]|nr:hypothetical protein C4K40_0729 [Pseudomonas sp. CMR5c]
MWCKKFAAEAFGRKMINVGEATLQKGYSAICSGYPQPGAQ